MAEHNYKFNVAMSCGGCSGAVTRVLQKLDGNPSRLNDTHRSRNWHRTTGVKSFNVDLETQTAEVVAEDSLNYDKVLETIKKTGKAVKSGEADGQPMAV